MCQVPPAQIERLVLHPGGADRRGSGCAAAPSRPPRWPAGDDAGVAGAGGQLAVPSSAADPVVRPDDGAVVPPALHPAQHHRDQTRARTGPPPRRFHSASVRPTRSWTPQLSEAGRCRTGRHCWGPTRSSASRGRIRSMATPTLLYVTQVAPYQRRAGRRARRARPVGHRRWPNWPRRPGWPSRGWPTSAPSMPRALAAGPGGGPVHHRGDAVVAEPARRPPGRCAQPGAPRCWPSIRPPTPATGGTTTGCWSAPASTATPGPSSAPWTCSTPTIRPWPTSARPGGGTTRSTSSASCAPTPGCCWPPGPASSVPAVDPDGPRPTPRLGHPLSWCFTEGAGPGLLHLPRPLPPRLGEPRLPPPPGRGARLGAGRRRRTRPGELSR